MELDNHTWNLHLATENNDIGAVQRFIEAGTNVDSRNEEQQTPLHVAASKGFEVLARVLLGYGANINSIDEEHRTPIWLALENNHSQMVKMLTNRGANIHIKDKDQQKTPLYLAVERNQLPRSEEHTSELQSPS